MDYRQEQSSKTWRDKVFSFKGRICAVCGESETVEIHHVLPLAMGGTNEMNNLLVLCPLHHDQIHMKLKKRKAANPGRKAVPYEELLPHLERYFNNEIGQTELERLTGRGHSMLAMAKNRYREENNVKHGYRNNLDLQAVKRKKERKK